MVTSEPENTAVGRDQVGIVGNARHFLAARAAEPGAADAIAAGKRIAAILAPFDLGSALHAAVLVYPLFRDLGGDREALSAATSAVTLAFVDGLVQLDRFALPPDWQPGEALAVRQSEALRKMLLAVAADARLMLVRIAEQLYRLRASKGAAAVEQRRLAIEAREIYAPLASRLGIWQLKWELEDLALRYLEPETYQEIARLLNETRRERESFIETVIAELRTALEAAAIQADISGRPKHIFSIWRKMQRKNRGVEQIYDMRAVRIFVHDVRDCYAALGVVHNLWPYLKGEFDDYIANPKENNYQSLHTAVIGPGGRTVEVQIRTHEMHRHAELGVAAHWRYKEGGVPAAAFEQKIRFLRQLLEPEEPGSDLLERIRDEVFEDRVYAISPQGDVVEMALGATPLDFAYHVHTEVGHRCRGAKVNGRIVPLTHKVSNGDQIEIITGSQPQPSRDWLNPQLGYLASPRSRGKVRNWFRQQDREQNRRQGREILERELARLNLGSLSAEDVAAQMKLGNAESLYVALGAGDTTSAAIASAAQNLRGTGDAGDTLRTRGPRPDKRPGAEQIDVSGVGDLMCNFARCCRPVPPEQIIGYITQARGVSIHRQDCRNFLNLRTRHAERVISVDWGARDNTFYPAELALRAYDRQGLLRDISGIFADEKISVNSVHTGHDDKRMQVVMELTLSVPDLPSLSRAMSRLEQLTNVTSVTRGRGS
ncbi:MAG TPA: bifunctional (p)ppGpp synthetase/guanosine-3',5'-bis(diphosphate) 3'-pyrophosphohydrolase [Woeseiaceae bacterium]|nr:bifunctional (p)ppGpp synthetase/guanosine-3',5'-bis(diphosphate) 3'-pyrophosphohydrolase [Woeseiaceae bacterium]